MLAAGHADGRLTLLDLRALRTGEKGASSTHAAHRGAVQALCWSKAKTKQNNDVLFSSSGSHLLMRELSGFHGCKGFAKFRKPMSSSPWTTCFAATRPSGIPWS
ncbi:unnamed protein product [Cladocopium goreaui]|nr:unnamed protein product [Cladocopium goreaui]